MVAAVISSSVAVVVLLMTLVGLIFRGGQKLGTIVVKLDNLAGLPVKVQELESKVAVSAQRDEEHDRRLEHLENAYFVKH